jgi:ribosomal protein uL13
MKIYNGENIILGRLAAVVAKELLLGEEVSIINCDKIVISGRKTNTFALEKQKRERGGYPLKSQKYSRLPQFYVKRTIRGMLPWKESRGKSVYHKLKCYTGIPEELAGQKLITLPEANLSKLPTLKYTTVEKVCRNLGGRF